MKQQLWKNECSNMQRGLVTTAHVDSHFAFLVVQNFLKLNVMDS